MHLDNFHISWQAFRMNEDWDEWVFHVEKNHEESLMDFIRKNAEYTIIPKYIINGEDLATWLNTHHYEEKTIDSLGQYINTLHNSFFGNYAHLPSFKLNLALFLGQEINLQNLTAFGFDTQMDTYDWKHLIKEVNTSVSLYGCNCGDRVCGFFPLYINKEENLIHWNLGEGLPSYSFDYISYQKQFSELNTLLLAFQEYKEKTSHQFSLGEEIDDAVFFNYFKKSWMED